MSEQVKSNDTVDRTMEYINEVISQTKDLESNWPMETLHEGLQSIIENICDSDHKIAVEFECGSCCKKVSNAAKIFFVFNSFIVLPAPCDCLVVRVSCCGKLVDKQTLKAIVIPVNKLCSIEVQQNLR